METFYMEVQYVIKLGVFATPTPPEVLGVTGTPEVVAVTNNTVPSGGGIGTASETVVYVKANSQAEVAELEAHPSELQIRVKGSKVGICKVSYSERTVVLSVMERRVALSVQEMKVKVSCPVTEVNGQKVGGDMAVAGSTIKLKAEFYDFNGALCDPEAVNFRVYDCNEKQIGETVAVARSYRKDVGIYEYLYQVPVGTTELTYEFEGIIEGNASIGRGRLNRTFGV